MSTPTDLIVPYSVEHENCDNDLKTAATIPIEHVLGCYDGDEVPDLGDIAEVIADYVRDDFNERCDAVTRVFDLEVAAKRVQDVMIALRVKEAAK